MGITGAISHHLLSMSRFTLLNRGLNARIIPIFVSAHRAVSSAATRKPTTKAATTKASTKLAGRAAATKRAAASSTKKATTAKKATTKGAATRKGAAPKKPAPRKKKVIELTDDQKERKLIRTLKVKALKAPPRGTSYSGYILWSTEQPITGSLTSAAAERGAKWKAMSQEAKDVYNTKAIGLAKSRGGEYEEWIRSHSVSTIREANNARRRLKALGVKRGVTPIADDRYPTRPANPVMLYIKEQYNSGRDLKGEEGKHDLAKASAILREEYTKLPASEKKRFEDLAAERKKRYTAEMVKIQKEKEKERERVQKEKVQKEKEK